MVSLGSVVSLSTRRAPVDRLGHLAAALDSSPSALRALLEASPDVAVLVDATGALVHVNAAGLELLGRGPHDAGSAWSLGRWRRVVDGPGALGLRVARGEAVDEPIALRRPGQGDLQLRVRGRPLCAGGAVCGGVLSFGEDVRARAEQLARSNLELEHFACVASHDLQEPLRMVASYTALLDEEYGPQLDAEAREYIAYARDGALRLQGMIRDLLEYSRVHAAALVLEEVDAGVLVEQVLFDLEACIEEHGAAVRVRELPRLAADRNQLGRVFQNLLVNAIKFRGPAPPAVEVSACCEGDEWVFSVRDNGIGIDPRNKQRIFRIFERLSGPERPGSGIGLAVCKRVIDAHGGRIWVEGAPGQGSTFRFSLPIHDPG